MNTKNSTLIALVLIFTALWLWACSGTANPAQTQGSGNPGSAPLAPTSAAGAVKPTPTNGQVTLNEIRLQVSRVITATSFPPGCSANQAGCLPAKAGSKYLVVTFDPQNLPAGDMVPYKQLPKDILVKVNTGETVPQTHHSYQVDTRQLSLGFEVPAGATGYLLDWPGSDSLVLNLTQ
jgi:hypothetical protein